MGKKIYYILGGLLAFTILIGVACAQKNQVRESERHSPEEETETGEQNESENEFEGVTLTMLNFSSSTPPGVMEKMCEIAGEKLGFEIKIDSCSNDNSVRTRLATGECPDLLVYNSGSLLYSLNPSEFFLDLTDSEMAKKMDEDFIRAASVDGVLYGIPQSDSMGAGVFYNKELYDKYGLEVPLTLEDWKKNMEILQDGEITGLGIALSDLVSSQLPFLADNYRLIYREPDFAQRFTLGETGFSKSRNALRSWERYEELIPYFNTDCSTVDFKSVEKRFFAGSIGHLIYFSNKIPEWMETHGEELDKIGFFALPGDTEEETGLTIWPSNAILGSKKSENRDAIMAFLKWYVSDEGMDVLTSFYHPAGVFHTGYHPKEKCSELVEKIQSYYDENKVTLALEYMTSVKGVECSVICRRIGSRRITAPEAAADYDEECRKMALKIGLWE